MVPDFLKNTWVTSDWHVGHNSVISFCKGSRGHFTDLEQMHETLITNYNSLVKPHQTCYFLGDFAFKGVEYGAKVLSQLNGHKILIRGNHDKGHQSLLNMGFAAVMDSASFCVFNYLITMSHFPLAGIKREKCENFPTYQEGEGWHGEYRYQENFHILKDIGQDIHLHGHLHCLTSDTEVLTKRGWKLYSDLSSEDLIVSRDTQTGTDEWVGIDKIITSNYSGDVQNIQSQHFHQITTSNHKFLIKNRKSETGSILSTFKKLPYVINEFPVTSNISGEGLDTTDDFIRLCVWIAADGSFEPKNSGVRFRLKKQRKIKALKDLLQKMGYKYTHCIRKSGVETIRFRYADYPELLDYFDPNNKELPKKLVECNNHQAKVVFHEYAITDGNYANDSKGVIQISTAKKIEADLLQEIFVKNNIYCKIGTRAVQGKDYWLLYANLNRRFTSVHKVNNFSTIHYDGVVWCLQVKNENFLIRHNGIVSFTGNSPNNGHSERIQGKQFDVGVDANDLRPISLRYIINTMKREGIL